jgi:peptide-methionine (S)-S-oxide reductase
MLFGKEARLVERDQALQGRDEALQVPEAHFVTGVSLTDIPQGATSIQLGMGCFWGAERKFWGLPDVITTAVGYAGGFTKNPTYREVCSGRTGHTEVVRVVYWPRPGVLEQLLKVFWENHDPTQGNRQGNDTGTQYRSAVYCESEAQQAAVQQSLDRYQLVLGQAGYPAVTTEVRSGQTFYFAEPYHQQYLAKNPNGYCGLGGTGVACPSDLGAGLVPRDAD